MDKYDRAISFLQDLAKRKKRESKPGISRESCEEAVIGAAWRMEAGYEDAHCLFQYATRDGFPLNRPGEVKCGCPAEIMDGIAVAETTEATGLVLDSDIPRLSTTRRENQYSGQVLTDRVPRWKISELQPFASLQRKLDKCLKRS